VLLHQAGLAESDVEVVVTGLLNFAPLLQGQVDATAATDTGLLVGRRRGWPTST
jgi:NitT/TauT family transport system substrate-binding protein